MEVIHILINKIQTNVRNKSFKSDTRCGIIQSRDFEHVFLCSREGTYMNKEEYKQYIIDAVKKIDNVKYLNRILNYVMKYLAKSGK